MNVLTTLILRPVILSFSQSLSKLPRWCKMSVCRSYRAHRHIYVKNSNNPPCKRGEKNEENWIISVVTVPAGV